MDEDPNRPVTPSLDLALCPGGVLCAATYNSYQLSCIVPDDDLAAASSEPILYQVDPWRAPRTPGRYTFVISGANFPWEEPGEE